MSEGWGEAAARVNANAGAIRDIVAAEAAGVAPKTRIDYLREQAEEIRAAYTLPADAWLLPEDQMPVYTPEQLRRLVRLLHPMRTADRRVINKPDILAWLEGERSALLQQEQDKLDDRWRDSPPYRMLVDALQQEAAEAAAAKREERDREERRLTAAGRRYESLIAQGYPPAMARGAVVAEFGEGAL